MLQWNCARETLSIAELAERAEVSHRTLQRFETADGLPDAHGPPS